MKANRPPYDAMHEYEVTRTSMISNITRTIKITFKLEDYLQYSRSHMSIHDALPYLTLDEREFIMTGITMGEWLEQFEKDKAEDRLTPDEDDLGDA